MERTSGVLMHISSLPSHYGIGTFGKSAYEFVDFLVETRQTFWQILPLTTTGEGNSPYTSFSAFAGNTSFIDLDFLVDQGYLGQEDLQDRDFGESENEEKINYNQVNAERRMVLEKAVQKYLEKNGTENEELTDFIESHEKWLLPYAQFMTLKEHFNFAKWYEWPEAFRQYDEEVTRNFSEEKNSQFYYHVITQYWFFKQWGDLKKYANDHFIQIFGDMPIYVSKDSVEMWQSPELFLAGKDGKPTVLSGTPPDSFAADGQFWGNPLYDWNYMEKRNYEWWIWRLAESFKIYDYVRLDHFRGFEAYWEIPADAKSAKEGRWVKGPGKKLFQAIQEALGDLKIVAEDLGYITKEVKELLAYTGFPGMILLQDAFDGEHESQSMPHNHPRHAFLYVGTHDNPTGYGWYVESLGDKQRQQADQYLNRRPDEAVSDMLNRGIAASPSRVTIYTMQDLLRLDNSARMNRPGTVGDNWDWRIKPGVLDQGVKERLLHLTKLYCRENKQIIG